MKVLYILGGVKAPKPISPEDLIEIIKPGDTIFIGSACSEPLALTDVLCNVEQYRLTDVNIIHFYKISERSLFPKDDPTRFRYNTLSIIGSAGMRKAINEGKADFTPIDSRSIPELLRGRRVKIDVALLQVTPPDKHGFCSLGINVDINKTVFNVAETVVAQINPKMPRTEGDSIVKFNDIDYFIYDNTLMEYPPPVIDDKTRKIAEYVARLIENGSTLAFGLGKVQYALPEALIKAGKKDLAIYSEVIPESVIELIKEGIINCSRNYYPHVMTSFILGTRRFYDFVDGNPFIEFHPIDYLADPENLKRNNKLCAVYSALTVDLFGQAINHVGPDGRPAFYGGCGAEASFIAGSQLSEGGKTIIALPSITSDGKSRIVVNLPPGPIVIRSIDVHYVVTEWGIAYLHGKTVRERVLQMIGIAHPKFRKRLLEEAKKLHLIYEDQEIPITRDGRVVVYPDISWTFRLKNGEVIRFMPVRPEDEKGIQDLYYSLSEKDRIMRFFAPQKIFSHDQIKRFINCDYESSMVIVGFAGEKEIDKRIVAIGTYFLDPNVNLAEFSVTVHPDYRKNGLARHIIMKLIELAEQRGIRGFMGDVYIRNEPMLHILNTLPYQIVFDEPEEDILHFEFLFSDKKER